MRVNKTNFLIAISIFSIFSIFGTCSNDETKPTNTCSPLWASWEMTFAKNTSAAEKSKQKSSVEEEIRKYVNRTDAQGNSSTVTNMSWTDNDNSHSTLNVYVESKDKNQKQILDSRGIRPASRVKLSVNSLSTIRLYEASGICSPLWASWDVNFPDGITLSEKLNLKSAFGDSIFEYVNNRDRLGNTCSVFSLSWTDFDVIHSRCDACVNCYDMNQRAIGDTTAVRPPSGVKPPAGLTVSLVNY